MHCVCLCVYVREESWKNYRRLFSDRGNWMATISRMEQQQIHHHIHGKVHIFTFSLWLVCSTVHLISSFWKNHSNRFSFHRIHIYFVFVLKRFMAKILSQNIFFLRPSTYIMIVDHISKYALSLCVYKSGVQYMHTDCFFNPLSLISLIDSICEEKTLMCAWVLRAKFNISSFPFPYASTSSSSSICSVYCRFLPSSNKISTFNIKRKETLIYYVLCTIHTYVVAQHTHHLVAICSHHSTVSSINFHIHFPLK